MTEAEEDAAWALLCELAQDKELTYDELDHQRTILVASAQARILRDVMSKVDAAIEAGMEPAEWLGRVAEQVDGTEAV